MDLVITRQPNLFDVHILFAVLCHLNGRVVKQLVSFQIKHIEIGTLVELFKNSIVNFRPIDLIFPALECMKRNFRRADHLHKSHKTLCLDVISANIQVFDTFGF